ncbi:MAG: T9SS type A sorting domain-containing protein [bacterium]|nr:T9SS type A sorting domain-containing protein [bacterium]
MKKVVPFLSLILLSINLFAQQADSVTMLPGTSVDVYYNLSTGTKDTVRNTNWHIAFAVRKAQPPLKTMQAATIIVNDGRSVDMYKSNQTFANWKNFDTSGWMRWTQTTNSDSTWDVGALNQIRSLSNPFDYGWGQYDMASKDVVGDQIWLMAIAVSPNPAAPRLLKKLTVHSIVYDTMWVFTISNIDGTDSNTVSIRKSNFNNKLFAYYNVLTNTVIDREPALNTWDILFTRYKTMVTLFGQTLMYPVMGVLHNPTVTTAKYIGADAKTYVPKASLDFKTNINQMGWDWKLITTTPGNWPIRDSLSYVVKTGLNSFYRLFFTEYFASSTRQNISFNKTLFTDLTSTSEVKEAFNNLQVYPNPASEKLNIELSVIKPIASLNVELMDITGRVIQSQNFTQVKGNFDLTISTATLNSGVYFLTVQTEGYKVSKKVVIN